MTRSKPDGLWSCGSHIHTNGDTLFPSWWSSHTAQCRPTFLHHEPYEATYYCYPGVLPEGWVTGAPPPLTSFVCVRFFFSLLAHRYRPACHTVRCMRTCNNMLAIINVSLQLLKNSKINVCSTLHGLNICWKYTEIRSDMLQRMIHGEYLL